MLDNLGRPGRVLLLGGTSEIGLAIVSALRGPAGTEVLLAGRDEQRMAAAGKELPYRCSTIPFDALEVASHDAVIGRAFADGPIDLVIAATGVLTPQADVDTDPVLAARMIEVNFTSHVTTLLAAASRMRRQRHGTIVVLSSVAAIRPRKANYVYGAAKAGLDAFARGLTDALAGTGVRVVLVRPGFVTGRMTAGLSPAPLASSPDRVGAAVAAALDGRAGLVWVPRSLAAAAVALRMVPRPVWRKMRR
ncbi:MAG TPA: SDR family NAD(P)-dependent oxidoreductase [Streptosporangiaceae bacterium]|nr:SDR family NAD(P)-dependent oxidoreductase [Streptosporangiaceae bacterium]